MPASTESVLAWPRCVAPQDPLWAEVEAFLCRSVRIPARHGLGPHSRLRRDLQLSASEQEDLMERFFAYFRVERGDYDRTRACTPRLRAWPWRRTRRAHDISAGMLLGAVRRGYWGSEQRQARSDPAAR